MPSVGSPTQRCQLAPSVTSERGTVLVNFVGLVIDNVIRSGQKAGIYLLSLAVYVVNAWGESNTLLPIVFTPTLCCLVYSLQHCAAWCIHFNTGVTLKETVLSSMPFL